MSILGYLLDGCSHHYIQNGLGINGTGFDKSHNFKFDVCIKCGKTRKIGVKRWKNGRRILDYNLTPREKQVFEENSQHAIEETMKEHQKKKEEVEE